MKYRNLRRRLSVSAPRMTVRTHVPLPVQIGVVGVALLMALGCGVFVARTATVQGLLGDPNPAVGRLAEENRTLRAERDRLAEAGHTVDSSRVMERSTIKELGDQIARLESDNTRLKEDVAFFEAATADRASASKATGIGIAIRRFQVTQDKAAHNARYRVLLTQDSRASADFAGTLQLAVTLQQGSRTVNISVPENAGIVVAPPRTQAGAAPATEASRYAVVFRSYKRIDGTFDVPADAVVKSAQVRILERGTVRVQQTVTLD